MNRLPLASVESTCGAKMIDDGQRQLARTPPSGVNTVNRPDCASHRATSPFGSDAMPLAS
jgi:hypothetical protein